MDSLGTSSLCGHQVLALDLVPSTEKFHSRPTNTWNQHSHTITDTSMYAHTKNTHIDVGMV